MCADYKYPSQPALVEYVIMFTCVEFSFQFYFLKFCCYHPAVNEYACSTMFLL